MNCDRLGTLKRTEQQEKIKGPRLTPLGFVVSAISALFKGFIPAAGAFVIVSLNSQPNEIWVIYGSVKAIAHL
nr:MAG TPA_asm: hypothetical protein [Caudoviricetes sp.]